MGVHLGAWASARPVSLPATCLCSLCTHDHGMPWSSGAILGKEPQDATPKKTFLYMLYIAGCCMASTTVRQLLARMPSRTAFTSSRVCPLSYMGTLGHPDPSVPR